MVRTVEMAKECFLPSSGIGYRLHIEAVSFDHDMGMDEQGNLLPTGMDFAKWLVEYDQEHNVLGDDFYFIVHSANGPGAANIQSLMESYLKFKRES